MIDILLDLEFTQDDIEILLKEINLDDIDKAKYNLDILKSINISDNTIKNIIITNPIIFNNNSNMMIELINKLHILGFDDLDSLFDKNPFLLNNTSFELELYISKKIDEGLTKEEIIESFNLDPFIMD